MSNPANTPKRQTKIRATCPHCGEVELTADDVELKVGSSKVGSFYSFNCRKCDQTVAKRADERVVRLLISGGVHAEAWNPPAEAFEPHRGEPISYDDLLEMHLLLNTPDWWASLQAACRA